MIEYIYDAIRAVKDQDIQVSAIITNPEGENITSGCSFVLHIDNDHEYAVDGEYLEEMGTWQFNIPADITADLKKGRYFYSIRYKDDNLCFLQPFYLE